MSRGWCPCWQHLDDMWELRTVYSSAQILYPVCWFSLGGPGVEAADHKASWPETDLHEAVTAVADPPGRQGREKNDCRYGLLFSGHYRSRHRTRDVDKPCWFWSRSSTETSKLDGMTKAHRAPETREPRRVKEFDLGVELKSDLCARRRHLKPDMSCRRFPSC